MSPFQNITIYYFSGTGNSKNVAKWFSEVASKQEIPCELVNISEVDRLHITPPSANSLVVFASPVHGFNYPPVMLHFIARFPKGKNKVLLLNTRAGMLIGKWVTPGLTGFALLLSSFILKIKGYSIVGMVPFDLPSNWISVHPGLNDRTVKYLHHRVKERVVTSAERVLSGKNYFKALREIIQDIIISPISILYYLIGRFVIAKTYYASSDCNNCDICIKGCPVKAISKVDNRPFWSYSCESCMKCMSHCPKKAIETAHGSIVAFSLINYLVLVVLFYKYVTVWIAPIDNEWLKFVIESLLYLGLFGIWYRIIHYLMRLKWFERIIVYTSLTKYKWWGRRYKALKDI